MENFIVSARKYRPKTFDAVVGQHAITATLKSTVKSAHLAHAYLFCGPRGVGKTTCARIFAKTINCQNPTKDGNACGKCESCESFESSRSFNIHELDAASNNSVEDIRNLVEQVRIPPVFGKYNVYIIDEVHMLSANAFNAFLKTLEEPPSYAIFILATTEKHKIIPTILSRCQIFDFKRITVGDAVEHLKYIAKTESIEFDEEGLNVIAQKADGAMRDALTSFDQLVSVYGNKVSYEQTVEMLGVLKIDYYFKLTDSLYEGNVAEALVLFDKILADGFDALDFITGLGKHLRNVLVCKDKVSLKLLDVSGAFKEKFMEQAEKLPQDFIFEALRLIEQGVSEYRTSTEKRLCLEISLIKLAQIEELKKKD